MTSIPTSPAQFIHDFPYPHSLSPMQAWIADAARVRHRRGIIRHTHVRSTAGCVDLASNDYLGLATDPRLQSAAIAATERYGTSARASRVVSGTLPIHTELEESLQSLTCQPAALVFSSGYAANLGILTALGNPGTTIISDEHVHASLRDAARLTRAPHKTFGHCDLTALHNTLATKTTPRAIVVIESIYSVLGDAAPVSEIAELCKQYDAVLIVDEAHGIGVAGNGRGGVYEAGLAGADHVFVTVTLSKALGSQGGAVLGPTFLREHLVNTARSFIFDTGLAPASAAAANVACHIIESEPERVHAVHHNSAQIASECGIPRAAGAVQSVPIGDAHTAASIAEQLYNNGVLVGCFRPPSTPDGVSRLRLTANATLTSETMRFATGHLRSTMSTMNTAQNSFHCVRNPHDVREVCERVEDFAPTNALTSVVPLTAATLRTLSNSGFTLPPVLASATGDAHQRVRRIVAGFFSPAKVKAMKPRVRELTQQQCQSASLSLHNGRPVDLATVFSQHIPPNILTELTGDPIPDITQLKQWSRDSLELFWGRPDAPRQQELAHSACELYTWLREAVTQSRDSNSLFGKLHASGVSATKICSLGFFLIIAGQETTSQLINIALYRALANRTVWNNIARGHSSTSFVRRILASESSVPTWRRITTRQTRLGESTLPAGTEILLELTGNHPHNAPPNAYTLAFGYGIHRCLGAQLAEIETVTVLQEIAHAFPELILAGPEPQWFRLLSFQSPHTVYAKMTYQI